ncbi:hypothetical protein Ahy_Scaffold1g107378 isoform B [Arachis hypogaea]|uniref:Uncharacterized protein n=1 Tax=Arachis hypogaea TaxID=3818 RepID=A0A444WVH1_ARAHY|nr:hypothetical protein Ahy_Scaffold1g107378 isoform B [Arachis hypogaea]
MVSTLINANPIIYEKKERRTRTSPPTTNDDYAVEPIDQLEIFDILYFFLSFIFQFLFFFLLIEYLSSNMCMLSLSFSLTISHIT